MSNDATPRVFRLGEPGGLQIAVSDFGATWLSCLVPVGTDAPREVLLGHATPADYRSETSFVGATVGRYANRIAQSRFTLDGRSHALPANDGPHHLHGGPDGFSRRRWAVTASDPEALRLSLQSPAGDQGYPGTLAASVVYRVDAAARTVHIAFEASVDAPSPVCLTNHAYFNLDGQPGSVLGHRLRVAAAHMLPTDAGMIPLGHAAPVDGTPFDLRQPQTLGARLGEGAQQQLAGGYDHCYLLDDAAACGAAPAAELQSTDGRVVMRLHTNYPGLQVYSGNWLAASRGRDGQPFVRHAGVALEPQFRPDSPNHPEWCTQDCILRPGQVLQRWIRLSFSAA